MKKKQTKTGPKSVTGFSILKIYLQEKQQKEDWILNRKRRNRKPNADCPLNCKTPIGSFYFAKFWR